jgi:glycosyltransferase involved in cell wall biosynthesis
MGGALRFLAELDGHLERRSAVGRTTGRPTAGPVRLVGRGRGLSPAWLVGRERTGRHRRAVALNNISFVTARSERWVLLRNLLHFLGPADVARLPGGLPTRVARTAPLVRACARRADVVVVPTTEMAERVAALLPELSARLVVRPHPLSRPAPVPVGTRHRDRLLCPVLFSPFKAMGALLVLADRAAALLAAETGTEVEITVTATEREAAAEGLTGTRRLRFVGRLDQAQLAEHQRACRALLYPTRFESFGYPLAEARLAGLPVIALDATRNREVAGPVLVPYQREEPAAIAAAMDAALRAAPPTEPGNPFDPDRYFDWLLDAR